LSPVECWARSPLDKISERQVCCLGLTRRSLLKDAPRWWAKASGSQGHHRPLENPANLHGRARPRFSPAQREPPCTPTVPRSTAGHVSLRQFRLSGWLSQYSTRADAGERRDGGRWWQYSRCAIGGQRRAKGTGRRLPLRAARHSRHVSARPRAEATARSPMPRGCGGAARVSTVQPASHRGRTRGAPVTGVRWLRASAGSPCPATARCPACTWDVAGARRPPPRSSKRPKEEKSAAQGQKRTPWPVKTSACLHAGCGRRPQPGSGAVDETEAGGDGSERDGRTRVPGAE